MLDEIAPAAEGAAVLETAIAPAAGEAEAGQGEGAAASGQGSGSDNAAAGGAPAEGDAKAGEGEAGAQGAPAEYTTFTLPENYELSGEMLDGVTAFAKANKLTQDQAQAVVDLGAKQAQAIVGQLAGQAKESPVLLPEHWAGVWSGQTASDPVLGGANLKSTMALATRVFDTFGTPELGKFLNDTGATHHPELIRFFHAVGKAVSEDTLVTARGGETKTPVGRDPAKKLFPNQA